jgi:hypothetical protein
MHRRIVRSGSDVWSELLRLGYLSGTPVLFDSDGRYGTEAL